jgi:hypothetical protein
MTVHLRWDAWTEDQEACVDETANLTALDEALTKLEALSRDNGAERDLNVMVGVSTGSGSEMLVGRLGSGAFLSIEPEPHVPPYWSSRGSDVDGTVWFSWCGQPTEIPLRCFVPWEKARLVVQAFCLRGERSTLIDWVET